jgi:hypothetical protein
MTRTRILLVLCAAVLAGCAAGCSAGEANGGGAAAGGSPSAGPASAAGGTSAAAGVWREFVGCARAQGQTQFPDPVVGDDGAATFPQVAGFDPKSGMEAVRASCGRILDRLPAGANPLALPVLSREQIEAKLRDAKCMRDNGVPEWPDPGADGYYHDGGIPGYPGDPAVMARVNAAREVCDPLRVDR